MLDIKVIRKDPQGVAKRALSKGCKVDTESLVRLDDKRIKLSREQDELRGKLKLDKKPTPSEQKKLEKIKTRLLALEKELAKIEFEWKKLMLSIPALPREDVKQSLLESENEVIREVGKLPRFDFKPKSHLELTKDIDIERAAKVSGSRFAYLKGKIAKLELALINYAFDVIDREGFVFVFPPVLIGRESMAAMGYLEHGGENEIYHLKKDDLFLVGTSEHSIGPMHKNEIFKEEELPLRYFGFSPCFRREAGSSGKDTKGIFRVHQFDKVEMFSFTKPEDSDKEHEFLLYLQERIVRNLEIPYRVTKMVSGDLGMSAARKYDIECWIPSQGRYRETHSTSTCVDFQSRRLDIKYRDDLGNKDFVHTLNGTAIAIGRMIIAILENYQQKDGNVQMPKVLWKYTGFKSLNNKN